MNTDFKESFTNTSVFATQKYSSIIYHTIKSECMETIKSELSTFANDNCKHIINHSLEKDGNVWTLTIQYI